MTAMPESGNSKMSVHGTKGTEVSVNKNDTRKPLLVVPDHTTSSRGVGVSGCFPKWASNVFNFVLDLGKRGGILVGAVLIGATGLLLSPLALPFLLYFHTSSTPENIDETVMAIIVGGGLLLIATPCLGLLYCARDLAYRAVT